MTPERWARLKAIFQGALDQPAEQRAAWLAQACGGDEPLRREAESLLRSHDTAGDFLEEPARLDPADVEAIAPGTPLGPYQIVREIARGGMGVVYLARDSRLERNVALKVLPPYLATNPELRDRLRREARAAATIAHPGVATVYSLDEIGDQLIIASEFVDGDTLRSEIARGPIEAARARHIAMQIAGALAAAHAAGVVHRDLKPENVIVTPADMVKVVDFGIAHIEAPESTRLTRAGAMLGTPAYMAPEQLLGGTVDARADIYAFGVLFSEMLTGRHPLIAADPIAVPPSFAVLIARCLQPNPDARFTTARDLLRALEGDTAQADLAATTAPAATGSPRWWWEFHQAVTALVYWAMTVPVWRGRQIIGGSVGRALFIVALLAVIVAANLRLHLWFTSRFYPGELRWTRRHTEPWIRRADWLFAAVLIAMGLVIGEDRSPIAIVLVGVGAGAVIAFLVIERATARAAFKSSATPRPPVA